MPDLRDDDLLARNAALAAATNGIVIVDASPGADGPIVFANAGFERMTGYSAAEVIGRNCRLLQGPDTDRAAVAEMRTAVTEHRGTKVVLRNYRKDGTPFWNEVVLSPVHDGERVRQYIGVQLDVTERKLAEEQVEYLAFHDALTGAANRRRLEERLTAAIAEAGTSGHQVALLYVDLDDFKSVNDRFGHRAGDELLRQVTERLSGLARPRDLLARHGGDEFLLLLTEIAGGAPLVGAEAAERVAEALDRPFIIANAAIDVFASIGVSTYPQDAADADELLQHADAAMYAAKADGGGVRVYSRSRSPRRPAGARPTEAPPALPEGSAAELARILDGRLLHSVYQPIVELETERVVAFEALARGPEGSSLERPDLLFAAAREHGRLAELEWACRVAAVQGALDAGLGRDRRLFVNVEPSMIATPPPADAAAVLDRGAESLDLVLELTERALTDRPADLLARIDGLRRASCAIALDDVGADRRSLALMPFVAPEVIKLDLRLVHENPTPEIAAIVHAVNAEAERTGAAVLAEGIETPEQREVARALGATLAQGWLFGRPGPLPAAAADAPARPAQPAARPAAPRLTALASRAPQAPATPFEVVRARQPVRRGTKRLLLAISKHLETQVQAQGDSAVLLATFQEARHFTPLTQARYRRLAQLSAFVGALGVGLPGEPVPGVRGADISEVEPLRGEWDVVVVGPHFAAAFVAADLGDEDGPDMDRRFDFCLTYDRDLVVAAGRALMARVAPRD